MVQPGVNQAAGPYMPFRPQLMPVGMPGRSSSGIISEHLISIYETGELTRGETIRKFRIVQREGNRDVSRNTNYYNLDEVISVGYRVNSIRATQFRQWATRILRQFAIKG